jgi:hypothetical protein
MVFGNTLLLPFRIHAFGKQGLSKENISVSRMKALSWRAGVRLLPGGIW